MKNEQKSFTLIELLVVIALIGLLAAIVLVSLAGARERAKRARADAELNQIKKAIILAQFKEDKHLGGIPPNPPGGPTGITDYWCSECSCRNVGDLSKLGVDHECIVRAKNVFDKLGIPFIRDPWGSPYIVDENELEFLDNLCRLDFVRSAGPNRTMPDADDILIFIPFYSSTCAGK